MERIIKHNVTAQNPFDFWAIFNVILLFGNNIDLGELLTCILSITIWRTGLWQS
jgi:hypothetical protein